MFRGEIEKKLRLFTGHGRGAFKEVIEGFPVLQMIEKHLHRHPRPGKTGGAAHAFRVDPHNLKQLGFLFLSHTV